MAGRIPQAFIDHLLTRVDLVELIDNRVPLRKAGRNFTACCPFHNEKTASFTVSPEKQFYHCFGCGAHGTAIGFLMEYDRLEFVDAIEELAQSVGIEVERESGHSHQSTARHQHDALFDIMAEAERFFRQQIRQHPQRKLAIDYLRSRGLDSDTVNAFGIGYAPTGWDHLLKALSTQNRSPAALAQAGLAVAKDSGGHYDRFRDRIMFPIRDRRGRTIAFGGRGLTAEATPKYLNSPETPIFHKGRELYGFFEARKSTRQLQRLVVVEGYMDVVALAQFGIRYAVATLGTATTGEHLERLFRTCPEVIFCYDGDRAGREAAWRALEHALPLLRDGRHAKFLFLPDTEDPDSLVRQEGAEAFTQRLQNAMPLSDYLFAQLEQQIEIHSIDGRARLIELARPLLQKLPQGAFRDLLLLRLAEHAKIPLQRLQIQPP